MRSLLIRSSKLSAASYSRPSCRANSASVGTNSPKRLTQDRLRRLVGVNSAVSVLRLGKVPVAGSATGYAASIVACPR
jgi:hypothetical protein